MAQNSIISILIAKTELTVSRFRHNDLLHILNSPPFLAIGVVALYQDSCMYLLLCHAFVLPLAILLFDAAVVILCSACFVHVYSRCIHYLVLSHIRF